MISIFFVTIICFLGLFLLTKRWVWVFGFGIGGLAAAFSTLASIFHFQILGALGFFFLTIICWFITVAIADGS